MRATLVFVALLTVASGLPAHLKVDKPKAHESSKDILEYIESIFEKTCHNLCLKRFPEAGAAQDKCMSICHRKHPDSSHSDMNGMDDMKETSDNGDIVNMDIINSTDSVDSVADKDNMDSMSDHTM